MYFEYILWIYYMLTEPSPEEEQYEMYIKDEA